MKKRYSIWTVLLISVVVMAITCSLTAVTVASYVAKIANIGGDSASFVGKYQEIIQYIESLYIGEIDTEQIEDNVFRALIDGLGDRWSYYMSEEEYKAYQNTVANKYVGIGVTVSWDDEENNLIFTKVSKDSPAEEAGFQAGDRLVAVDGQKVADLGYTETLNAVSGEEGTSVSLTVLGEDGVERIAEVTRRELEVESVSSEMLGEIGYIRIENFDEGVADRFMTALDTVLDQGAKALIFDVRVNPGGRLNELTEILDRLLPEGPIFRSQTKEQEEEGKEDVVYSDEEELDLPMAVLIGEYSYSAAEFFPAALHEYGKAVLVGTPTTGKGYAQIPIELSDGSAIVLSIKRYVTPNGVSLAEEGGIDPDYTVEMTEEQLANFLNSHDDDPVLDKAIEVLETELASTGNAD